VEIAGQAATVDDRSCVLQADQTNVRAIQLTFYPLIHRHRQAQSFPGFQTMLLSSVSPRRGRCLRTRSKRLSGGYYAETSFAGIRLGKVTTARPLAF
jgi:hypothetical protein